MADKSASAFVSSIIKDKKFRDEVIANIPEELMREDDNNDGGEMDLAKFAGILKPAGDAMGGGAKPCRQSAFCASCFVRH